MFTPVHAQEMLNGKVVIGKGICSDIRDDHPCLLLIDPKRKDIAWIVAFGKDEKPLYVVEMDAKTGDQKIVWDRMNQTWP